MTDIAGTAVCRDCKAKLLSFMRCARFFNLTYSLTQLMSVMAIGKDDGEIDNHFTGLQEQIVRITTRKFPRINEHA